MEKQHKEARGEKKAKKKNIQKRNPLGRIKDDSIRGETEVPTKTTYNTNI